jgi:hypothetical protein
MLNTDFRLAPPRDKGAHSFRPLSARLLRGFLSTVLAA